MGVREQIIFPEIDYDAIDQVRGLDMTIMTTAASRRGGVRAPRGVRHALRQEGRPGGKAQEETEAEEEEKRKEEARLRAEAEQAALEQLKEENPEAYEKPAEPEEGEEGEGDEDRPPATPGAPVEES